MLKKLVSIIALTSLISSVSFAQNKDYCVIVSTETEYNIEEFKIEINYTEYACIKSIVTYCEDGDTQYEDEVISIGSSLDVVADSCHD